MTNYELMDLLGRAFACGEVDNIASHLAQNCEYESEYAHRRVQTAEKIIERMKQVHSKITDESKYTYQIIPLDHILREIKFEDFSPVNGLSVIEFGLLLFQYSDKYPVAVVVAMQDDNGKLGCIQLSRNTSWFNVDFYMEEVGNDSPYDLPSTVQPLTPHDRQVKELRRFFSGQHLDDIPEEISGDLYIWKKADEFIKSWLHRNGYKVLESRVFDDCIGYRCNRKNYAYTIFMFAYGKEKTAQLDGEYCQKLLDLELSKNSAVLVVYLNVKRFRSGNEIEYKVCHYGGNEDVAPELWHVTEANGKPILEYFPRKEMMDATFQLMYAFNHDNLDVYDCIVCEKNPAFQGLKYSGSFINSAFYTILLNLHKEYGEMKYGYVRYNDVVYSGTPYLEGYGFFGLRVDNSTDRILEVTAYPFDGGDKKVAEYIKTDERENGSWLSNYPRLVKAEALPPVKTERFSLKLTFANGEIKKYVLPISDEFEIDEAVSYMSHVFTDKIWRSVTVIDHRDAEINGYAQRGAAVEFKNGFFISGLLCYQESEAYSEPIHKNEVLFEDASRRINRLWTWHANAIWEDEETGILKVLLSGDAFNHYGVSTYASRDGKRLCSINFDYIGNFHDGLAEVGKSGYGMGFVDRNMKFVIPMIYDQSNEFKDGRAKVKRGGRWLYIDRSGKEIELTAPDLSSRYQDVGDYSEGLCKVSTLKLRLIDLAHHSDYSEIAGTWGFVNEAGEEVITPQFIYAEDFSNGIAIVCKGKWTIDKKWDNEYNTGRYWTDEELWGAIDKSGNVVIPFIFDEIRHFWDTEDVFMVHYGGWKEGHWGVIDNRGNWLAEPVFEAIDYDYHDGLFAFYKEDKWSDDVPLGIYDLKQKRVIFEPQFFDVSFREDGWIEVEVYDEQLGRKVEKFIDRNGNEKFHSIYTSIYAWKKPYEVVISDENGERHGLIDENGNVILPCEYDVSWSGISYEQKRIVFKDGDKHGIKDFDGNIIVPPIYYEIHSIDNPLLIVRVGEKDDYKEGLITPDGTTVVPAEFSRISWCSDNYIICCHDGHCEMLRYVDKNN